MTYENINIKADLIMFLVSRGSESASGCKSFLYPSNDKLESKPGSKTSSCFKCGKPGHRTADCWS